MRWLCVLINFKILALSMQSVGSVCYCIKAVIWSWEYSSQIRSLRSFPALFFLSLEQCLARSGHLALTGEWKDQGKLRRQIFSPFSDLRNTCLEGNGSSGLDGGVTTWNACAWFSLTQFPEIPRELPIGSLGLDFCCNSPPHTHPASKSMWERKLFLFLFLT